MSIRPTKLRVGAVVLLLTGGALLGGAAFAGTSGGPVTLGGYGTHDGCTAKLFVSASAAAVQTTGTCTGGTLAAYQLDSPPVLWPQTLRDDGATQVSLPACAWQVDYMLGPVQTQIQNYFTSVSENVVAWALGGSGSCTTATTTAPPTTAPPTTAAPTTSAVTAPLVAPTTAVGGGALQATTTTTAVVKDGNLADTASTTTTTAPATVAGTVALTAAPKATAAQLAFTGPPSSIGYLASAGGLLVVAGGGVLLFGSSRRRRTPTQD